MYCTKCGCELVENARFCTRCGAPVVTVSPRTDEDPTVDSAEETTKEPVQEPAEQPAADATQGVRDSHAPLSEDARSDGEGVEGQTDVHSADVQPVDGQVDGRWRDAARAGSGDRNVDQGGIGRGDEGQADAERNAGQADNQASAQDETIGDGDSKVPEAHKEPQDKEPAAEGVAQDAKTVEAAPAEAERVETEHAETVEVAAEADVFPDIEAERAEAALDAAAAQEALWADAAADNQTDAPGYASGTTSGVSGTATPPAAEAWSTPADEQSQTRIGQTMSYQAVSEQAPEKPPTRRRGPLIAALVVLVIAAVVAVCVFVLPSLRNDTVITYGQSDPVEISSSTRLVPRDADGNNLRSYTAKLLERTAGLGDVAAASEDLGEAIATIDVDGTGGFTFDDFGTDLPSGDFWLIIEMPDASASSSSDADATNGSSTSSSSQSGNSSTGGSKSDSSASNSSGSSSSNRVPVHFEPENEEAEDEVILAPDSDEGQDSGTSDDSSDGDGTGSEGDGTDGSATLTEEQLAAAQYYDKCLELIDEYGEPGTDVLADQGDMVVSTGLSLVTLIDFDGDGEDELLVAYLLGDAGELLASYAQEFYGIEVWDYQDGELVQVYDGFAEHSNGGTFYLDLEQYEERLVIKSTTYDDDGTMHAQYFAYGADGFELLAEWSGKEYYSSIEEEDIERTVEGEAVTEDEWNTFLGSLTTFRFYELSTFSTTDSSNGNAGATSYLVTTEDMAEQTEDTLDELAAAAGDAIDEEESESTATYTSELVEETETIPSSQGEGLDFDTSATWCYPRFTLADGSTTAVLDDLNEMFKEDYERDLETAQAWTYDSGTEQVQVHRDQVTYLEGSIACVRQDRYCFYGGAHGTEVVTHTYYDLATGEGLTVDEALGISMNELQADAQSAITAYVESGAYSSVFGDSHEDTIEDIVTYPERYGTDEKGIYISIMPYEIGSYAEGLRLVYVYAFDDDSLVGTDAGSFEWGQ